MKQLATGPLFSLFALLLKVKAKLTRRTHREEWFGTGQDIPSTQLSGELLIYTTAVRIRFHLRAPMSVGTKYWIVWAPVQSI